MKQSAIERCKDNISVDYLRGVLSYNSSSGCLTWISTKPRSSKKPGDVAGYVDGSGYLKVKVCGELLLAHRVSYALHIGSFPDGYIDHVNGDKIDNRFCNLRVVNCSHSQVNRAVFKNNTSGYRGVTWNEAAKSWSARCAVNGKRIHIGYFNDAKSASLAYESAAIKLHGEFRR